VTRLPASLFSVPLPGIARPLARSEGEQFEKYLALLQKWQRSQRLLGSAEPAWIIDNVFVHSLCFLEALPPGARVIADVGSGAGVPGVPIAIVRPDVQLTLIEARQRRASFLATAVRELSLMHVAVVGDRVEKLDATYHRRFDAVVMRCAGDTHALLDVVSPLLRCAGVVVASAHPSRRPPADAEEIAVASPSGVLRTFHRYVRGR
jgi:16S rRNA (guanine527-N7)-methyltransferase